MSDDSSNSKQHPEAKHSTLADSGAKRPYQAPRVLSAEPLEAAAATCDPPAGGFGKTVPIPCGTAGS